MGTLSKTNLADDTQDKTSKSSKHYHMLERMKTKNKRKDIYRCLHPDCNFYSAANFLVGKYAICRLCYTRFTLSRTALSLKTPHCGCRNIVGFDEGLIAKNGATEQEQAAAALQILKPLLPERKTSD